MEACLRQKSVQRQFSPNNTNTIMKGKGYGDRSNKINKNYQKGKCVDLFNTTVSLFLKKMYMHGVLENLYVNIVT